MPLDSVLLLFKTKTITKLLKLKHWKTEITDHALATNTACGVLRLASNRYSVPSAMARTKRKWTREAIEEVLLQDTRVDATPAEPDDTAAKQKRQQRRSNKKRNPIKELNALSVTGTDTAAPHAVPGLQAQPMLHDQTTLEQEGKREEDDPADHQRRFAVAAQNPAEHAQVQHEDLNCRAKVRAEQTDQERDVQRQQNRVRRKAPQRGNGHVNHEAYRASMATGKNVVDRRHRLSPTTVCPLCQAWKWPAESDFICCLKGRAQLPPLQPVSPRLLQLYGDKEFRRHIQAVPPKFAQIYIVDPDIQERANRRKGIFADLDIVALQDIENMMVECNPLAQQFLCFGQKLRKNLARGMQVKDIRYVLDSKPSKPITYNLPTVSEVGVAIAEDGNLTRPCDLYVVAKDHSLLRLFETDETSDPFQNPLLFPYEDLGWTYTDVFANGTKYRNKREMSLREHETYPLFQKVDDQTALHQGGRRFQQWMVDQRAKCEQEQLRWVAKNQKKLGAEVYHGIWDALLNEETITLDEAEVLVSEYDRATGTLVHPDRGSRYEYFLNHVGKRIVLPDSHSGSPRNMYRHYQASMAIVREYSKPDAFITMTCNPKWVEIIVLLPDDQTAQDRPDIVARVWQLKPKTKLADLDEGLLGRLEARIYVVGCQKRGLPHAHIVIIVAEEDKTRTREIIDKLVSAEDPDKEANPDLYEMVMTCMMHGPCGPANPDSPCMKDGKCTKGFPKPLLEVTQANLDEFPLYRRRRREPGVLIFNDRQYDNETVNQWVVLYNAYLCQTYDCHINVEVCTTIGEIKYLCKYLYKGSDRAVLTIEAVHDPSEPRSDPNEILRFLNDRYISPVEAAMRILTYEIQGKNDAVTTLTVPLEGGQMVVFQPNDDPDRVLGRAGSTMLTSIFELCASPEPEDEIAKTMLYQEIPNEFSWDAKGKNLRTVDGVVHPTFQAAAMHSGFLENDQEWIACMSEASAFRMPYQLRQLFATLLVYSQVSDVRSLWDQFYDELDFGYNGQAVAGFDLSQLSDYPTLVLDSLLENNLIRRELEGYDHSVLQDVDDHTDELNAGQRAIYDLVLGAVHNPQSGENLFFIDGPGGTGKSTS
ncbi:unnamed protein product [Phytophthora fragariaefolia]|uniref:Unnamed protein product n=1 Tax=Phytophthora fragariaefolia TaxID=1490495 RepID=A0A9W6WUJ9_9STRA|nr:unnamed protein product [Phytophthora fragariaefolia]